MPQNPTFKIYIAKCIMLFKGGTLALPGPTIWMGEPRLELVPHKPRQNFQAVQAQHYFYIYPAGCLGWGRGGRLQNSAYSMLLNKLIQILEHLQLASYTACS